MFFSSFIAIFQDVASNSMHFKFPEKKIYSNSSTCKSNKVNSFYCSNVWLIEILLSINFSAIAGLEVGKIQKSEAADAKQATYDNFRYGQVLHILMMFVVKFKPL